MDRIQAVARAWLSTCTAARGLAGSRMRAALLAPFALLLLVPGLAFAAEQRPTFHPITGTVTIGRNLATIEVPDGMVFLAKSEARWMLEKAWGNPPDDSVEGLLLGDGGEEDDRVVVVSYDREGHVDDSDARDIDYADLLSSMQEGVRETSAENVRHGYRSEELLGWAEPPHYDAAARKLYWAKSIRFGDSPEPQLNYCIRILGREGVLELNALGATADLPNIAPVAQAVMEGSAFLAGQRYEDYQEGSDLAQAGGIAGLIAGGVVAKKLGFLALIGVLLAKFGKIRVLPAILVGGWLVRRRRAAKG
jgi:uncharacterized membrane-anchored protein